jgi:hypothetical protein
MSHGILANMQSTFELPETAMKALEALAVREGTTPAGLVQRIVKEHLRQNGGTSRANRPVSLPLIPIGETGTVQPIAGLDLDEMFAREDIAS